jgi:hypothetical protein
MKLPKFFRKLTIVSIWPFVGSIIAIIILLIISGGNLSEPMLSIITGVMIVAGVSFVTMIGSIIADPLVRAIENALLRQFGQPATATVLEFYGIKMGTDKGRTLYDGVRVKVEVHPSEGGSFESVAEDTSDEVWMQLQNGATFPVKYDPRTREVAFVKPKKMKTKKYDF